MIRQRPSSSVAARAAVAAILLVLAAGALGAQTFGRVVLTVTDADGQPLPGAKITVTCELLPRFHKELKTNKKGEATVAVVDATKRYQVSVELEGYLPHQESIKPRLGQTSRAQVVLRSVTSQVPPPTEEATLTPAQEVFNEGVAALQQEDLTTAEAKFRQALEMDPHLEAPVRSALGGLHLMAGQPESAIADAQALLALEPQNSRGYRILYEAHKALGDEKEAEKALKALSELDRGGDTVAMVYNEGVESFRVGDMAAAKARFAEALEMQPDFELALKGMLQVLLREESHLEAVAIVERLLALHPDDKNLLGLRHRLYKAAGDETKAQEALAALVEADPTLVVQQALERGVALYNAGDARAASEQFERALAVEPDNAKAHYHLGLCFVNLGDNAKAREHFERFLALAPDDPDAGTARDMLNYLE